MFHFPMFPRPLLLRRSLTVAALALSSTLAVPLATPATADATGAASRQHDSGEVVATGLDNPRLLSFARGGLYVAEAGRGGAGPCVTGEEGPACFGLTGAVTRIQWGHQSRVVTGLPSLAGADGSSATGPADVAVLGRVYVMTLGLGLDPALRSTFGSAGRLLGSLAVGVLGHHRPVRVADLSGYEAANDPDGNGPDSNPTGLLLHRGSALVTDSGGNDLLQVRLDGSISTQAVFPTTLVTPPFPPPPSQIPMQAVPTAVAVGPDGAYYVSQLTGFPFPAGGASIWRVVPGQAPTIYATGLTNVTDLAWDSGTLYAVQLSNVGLTSETGLPTGSLVRVLPGAAPQPVGDPLPAPYGVALARGSAYVTTCSVCAGGGQVVRIALR